MLEKVQAAVIIVLAAALGVVVSQLMDARRRIDALEKSTSTATTPVDTDGDGDTDADDDKDSGAALALRPMVQDLRARVQALEARGVGAPAAAAGASDPEDEVAAALGDGAASAAPAPGSALGAAVAQEIDKRELARDEVRNERARARVIEKVEALAKDGDLSPSQKQKLTDMLDGEQLEIRHLFRDAREGGDFATVRDQVRTLRQKTDENAKAVLDEDQLEAYQAMREEERARFIGALRE